MNVNARIKELGIDLPAPPCAGGQYNPVTVADRFAYVSGQTANVGGVPSVVGKLGASVGIGQGKDAARQAALNCVALLRETLGDLDRIEQVVKLNGYVASTEGFGDQPKVIDGASELLEEVFGAVGQHSRTSVGVAELPGGAPAEVELVVLVRPTA